MAAAAATRLLQNMETALEAEADNLHAWLEKLERLAELRQNAGRALFPEEALGLRNGLAAPTPMGPEEARAAARTARETGVGARGRGRGGVRAGGRKKEKAAKPADVEDPRLRFRY